MIQRIIPSSGEALPVIGMGTWQTFDLDNASPADAQINVLKTMQNNGARMIDTSPMYGNAEATVGRLCTNPEWNDYFFYATKVWTTGKQSGILQMENSFRKMNRSKMDLMQIHNLTDWKTQLQTLNEWKAEGKIRYTGITHYTDSMHTELERIISEVKLDFVQFNYSVFSRNAENSLLKTAADKGVATIINLPFGQGNSFSKVKNKKLPDWISEFSIQTWGQFFLIYIISHPAVTVVIPATSNPSHAQENFNIAKGALPDQKFREKMAKYVERL